MKFFKTFRRYNPGLTIVIIVATVATFNFLLITNNHSHDKTFAAIVANVQPALPKAQEAKIGYPVRLEIPSINANAILEYVGLSATGILNAPKKAEDAGWFVRGPKPGEKGNSVIDGHFGYENNIPAVFDNLHKLGVGDSVNVIDETGGNLQFVVREVKVFGEEDDASSIFGIGDGGSHLNLITCQGSWNETQKSYSGRLVVFTDLVPKT